MLWWFFYFILFFDWCKKCRLCVPLKRVRSGKLITRCLIEYDSNRWFHFLLACMYQKDSYLEVKIMLKMLRILVTIALALLVIKSGWQLEQSRSCWCFALVSYTVMFQRFISKFQCGTGIVFANVHRLIARTGEFIKLEQPQNVFLLKKTEIERVWFYMGYSEWCFL